MKADKNMQERFQRVQMLLGDEAMERLENTRVAIFGIGGVGGYVAEALARSGVGALSLIDSDKVALSNINRQIIATTSTVGRYKVEVMKERILDINPNAAVTIHPCFFLPENADTFFYKKYDYIADAVDTVTAKLCLIEKAKEWDVPIISSMGAGNKLNPTLFEVADIYETSVCPLAKIMRKELKKRNIKRLKVIYSKEAALTPMPLEEQSGARRQTPGSIAFVPSVAGLIMAGEIIRDITKGAHCSKTGAKHEQNE